MKYWGFSTKAIHLGIDPQNNHGATSIPIYQTSSFAYSQAEELAEVFDGNRFGYIYSRISNPTVTAFEQRINALENGVGAVATSSGMAAIFTVLFTLTSQGDEIVSSKSLFGGTFLLFNRVLSKYGVSVKYVDILDPESIKNAITEKTRALFLESIGNPGMDVPDIRKISEITRAKSIPLIADSTLTTPCLFNAKEHGVDVVIHSSTKYITGNGSTMGGVFIDLGTFEWESLDNKDLKNAANRAGSEMAFLNVARRNILMNTGACQSPFNAYLHCMGLETLELRMEKHCSNALTLAEYLESHPVITEINYPGLKDNRFHKIADNLFNGRYGGLLSFSLPSQKQCFKLINRLKLIKNLANLGDAKTLITHPASTIFHECTEEEMREAGVHEGLVRLSVGIEDVKDIIEDLETALGEVD